VRLNAQLRESDLITRVDEHSLWVILPYTMPQGLQSRIEKTMEKLAEEEVKPSAWPCRCTCAAWKSRP
jgi:PleD family two-component response regulator